MKKRKTCKTRYVLCAEKKPPVAAVITMRIFFVKYFLSTEVVLADSQNCKKRAKAVCRHGWPLATIFFSGVATARRQQSF